MKQKFSFSRRFKAALLLVCEMSRYAFLYILRKTQRQVVLDSMETKVSHKKRRLALDTRGVTDAALARIISQLKKNPKLLDSYHTSERWIRTTQSEDTLQVFDSLATMTKLSLEGGGEFLWHYFSFSKLLQYYVSASADFARVLKNRMETHPMPWRAILYHDEVTPGNNLRPANNRKFSAFYISFLEFGLYLRKDTAWLPIAMLRTSVVNKVIGGMSAVVATLILQLFDGPSSLAAAGFDAVFEDGGPKQFIANFSRFIFDEAALKATFNTKGASGLKPCLLCRNVLMKGHECLNYDDSNYFVDVCETDTNKFDKTSNHDLWETFEALLGQKAALKNTPFKKLQTVSGLSLNVHGVLQEKLRNILLPVDSCTYDPMHCYFQGGVASTEVHLLLQELSKVGIDFAHVRQFASVWQRSNKKSSPVSEILSDAREKLSDGSFKGFASDVLTVLLVLMHFVETVVQKSTLQSSIDASIKSFRALFFVVCKLQLAKMHERVPSQLACELLALQVEHLRLHKEAYGNDWVLPKHHFSLHFKDQLIRDQIVLDTFVHERRNKLLKSASNVLSTVGNTFERSVLSRAVLDDVATFQEQASANSRLTGATALWPELALSLNCLTVRVSDRMQVAGTSIKIDDVVYISSDVALVTACLEEARLQIAVS